MNILNKIDNIITEARSHSDINKRVTLFESLYQYRNKDYYVSFNNIEKIGINPLSIWSGSTMVGVFSYPLDFILYHLRNYYCSLSNISLLIKNNFKHSYYPIFAETSKNVYVLRRVDVSGKEFVFASEYNNFDKDFNIIKNVIDNDILPKIKNINTEYYNILLERRNNILYMMKKNKNFKGIIKGISKLSESLIHLQIIDPSIKHINKKEFGIYVTKFLIDKLNYSGIIDDHFSGATLHYNIPFETIFLHPMSYQIVNSFQNKKYTKLVNNSTEWQQKLVDMFETLDVSHYEKYDNRFK